MFGSGLRKVFFKLIMWSGKLLIVMSFQRYNIDRLQKTYLCVCNTGEQPWITYAEQGQIQNLNIIILNKEEVTAEHLVECR